MTRYKIIKDTNNDDNSSGTSNTSMPAENRKRHKPERGLPRTEK